MNSRNKSGFTLIELAIVIAIIGILAAVAIPKFSDMTKTAGKSVAQSLLQSSQTSAAIYVAQQRVPPTQFSDYIVSSGAATGAMTMTLNNVLPQLNGAPTFAGSQLTLTFRGGNGADAPATYYLDGTDVTAAYSANFDN